MILENGVTVLVDPLGRLDRDNAAKLIGITSKTLANWASKGLGPKGFRVGGRAFYWRDEVEAFARGERQMAAAA
ncbi:helix-turn-helix transcriptional regulator [Sphingomonas sp.]|uniref:helix-turn-helix transcriptional regulator n=1 Tax=Sphingomonas sp. TaxID=28214 RepID=UPI003753758B